jgi:ribosomal-protein-serine acetyltransferase
MKKIKVDPNIVLRPLSLKSAETIFESIHHSRKHLRAWLPFVDKTKSVLDVKNFIHSVLDSKCDRKDEVFEIWYERRFAGLFGLKEIDRQHNKVEFGYWLDREMTGKGIALKVCRFLTTYVFEHYNMNRVTIKTALKNEKSYRIAEELGFQLEGIEREGEYLNEQYHDLKVYSMLKRNWKA